MYKFNDVEMWMPFYCCSMTKNRSSYKKANNYLDLLIDTTKVVSLNM